MHSSRARSLSRSLPLSLTLWFTPVLATQGPPGPMGGRELQLVARFDLDGDHMLDATERQAAREWLKQNRQRGGRGGPPGFGPPGFGLPGTGPGSDEGAADPDRHGVNVALADAPTFPDRPFYDAEVVRTLFVTFPQPDWYEELTDFYRTDVDLPATLIVDGVTYPGIGVHFRGNTSYLMARGKKKSMHLSFDFVHDEQRVLGYRSTNLINGNEDPSCVREALNAFIAGRHARALQANLVRLVVNGEDLGVYVNLQHFNKDFLEENYGASKGSRFKVPPDFAGNGALRDLGDDEAAYQRNYVLKSDPDPRAWQRLRELCQLLEHGRDDDLALQLPGYLDIDDSLWFLAIDNAVLDGDGYYSRGSDYALWLDKDGRFHPIARDGNEVLGGGEGMGMRGRGLRGPSGPDGPRGGRRGNRPDQPPRGGNGEPGQPTEQGGPPAGDGRGRPFGPGGPGGPGGRGGPRGPAPDQPALAMIDDPTRPLVHRLLRVPVWRERYLWFLHTVVTATLDPNVIDRRLARWQELIVDYVRQDVHSLYGFDAFTRAMASNDGTTAAARSLRAVIEARRRVLCADPALQGPWPEIANVEHAFVGTPDRAQQLRVIARAAAAPPVARMTLQLGAGKVSSLGPVPMYDDGQHGDGAAGDGVFAATVDLAIAKTLRFYVEAATASGRAACAPASGGARPTVLTVPGQDDRDRPDGPGKGKHAPRER